MNFRRAFRLSFLILILVSMATKRGYAQREWTMVSSNNAFGEFLFATADTGYGAVRAQNEHALMRTTNGGYTWSSVILPIDSVDLVGLAVFGSSGWLLAGDLRTRAVTWLLKTTDYGSTWSKLPINFDGMGIDFYRFIFKSSTFGYLVGGNLLLTTDGGQSWEPRALPPSNGSIQGFIMRFGPPNVITGTGYDKTGDQHYQYPFISTDSGATWYRQEEYGAVMTYVGNDTWIWDNLQSTDNGQTWDTIPTTSQGVNATIITDTLGHGMFASYNNNQWDSVLYFTTDYGRSWDSSKVPFARIDYGDIVGDTWYVESNGQLYRSPPAPSTVGQTTQPAQFRILTNPTTLFLRISQEDIPGEIRIVDFLGRTVARYSIQGGEFSMDVSSLPEGLYWVVARSGALPFVHLSQ